MAFNPLLLELDPEVPGGDLSENSIYSYAAASSFNLLVRVEG